MSKLRERLLAYHLWATGSLLDVVADVSPDEFGRLLGGSFGSLRGLCTHVLGAEWIWLERLAGRMPTAAPDLAGAGTPAGVRDEWRVLAARHRERLAGAATGEGALDDPRAPFSYVNLRGQHYTYPRGDILLHVANHGTYHCGQLAHMLRQLGRTPPSTDYLLYLDEVPDAPR